MVDFCSQASAPKFYGGRAQYRILSPPAPSEVESSSDAPLNLCIKSEPTDQKLLYVDNCREKEHNQAGRLQFFSREGRYYSAQYDEYSNQRHSSGESIDSGIFVQRHLSTETLESSNHQFHGAGNSLDSGVFSQRNFEVIGGQGQRHVSSESSGGDPCQELGNLLIVSTLDTDIANEEIVECVETNAEADMEEGEDNLTIDDNAGGCERMDDTGNARESKCNDMKPDESRIIILNRKYNSNNIIQKIERQPEYLIQGREQHQYQQPSGSEQQYQQRDGSGQQLDAAGCTSQPLSIEESSQDSLQLLAAASMERSVQETSAATADIAISLAEGTCMDGPLHLLAAIAISAKANTNLGCNQLTAPGKLSAASLTPSNKGSARHKSAASLAPMSMEEQEQPAAAKRLRYHSWPQMATMTSSQRKKEQNKLASKRFRERKKQQMDQAKIEITELEVRNDLLRKKELYMNAELKNLRSVLLERNLIKIVQLPDGQTTVVATEQANTSSSTILI